ncbi:MAG: hypothetical protein ABIJ18_03315 [archaeon]
MEIREFVDETINECVTKGRTIEEVNPDTTQFLITSLITYLNDRFEESMALERESDVKLYASFIDYAFGRYHSQRN